TPDKEISTLDKNISAVASCHDHSDTISKAKCEQSSDATYTPAEERSISSSCKINRSESTNKQMYKVKVQSKKHKRTQKSRIRVKRHRSTVSQTSNSLTEITTSLASVKSCRDDDQTKDELSKTYYRMRTTKVATTAKCLVKMKRSKSEVSRSIKPKHPVSVDKPTDDGTGKDK